MTPEEGKLGEEGQEGRIESQKGQVPALPRCKDGTSPKGAGSCLPKPQHGSCFSVMQMIS